MPHSDHFDGKQFFNLASDYEERSFKDVLRWKLSSKATPWGPLTPVVPCEPEDRVTGLRVTMVNHSTMLVQHAGVNILTDPIWSERASPLAWAGPRRHSSPGVAMARLPPIDLVLVSHDHYDHCDLPTLRALEKAHAPLVIAGLGMRGVLADAGIRRVVELDWWQEHRIAGVTVTFTPAQHWSSRSPFERNTRLWGSFITQSQSHTFYFAADSGYGPHFKHIAERLGGIDLAAIPIGAYEPRWFMRPQHMNPHDAAMAHRDLSSRRSVGIHWGCFQLTDEGVHKPLEELAAARDALGIGADAFVALGNGQVATP